MFPRGLSSKVRMITQRQATRAVRALRAVELSALDLVKRSLKAGPRRVALIYRRMILIRYGLQTRLARHGRVAIGATIIAFILVGFVFAHVFQTAVEAYFNPERLLLCAIFSRLPAGR